MYLLPTFLTFKFLTDLQKLPNERSQSKSLPSPRLTSVNMSQTKMAAGSPKSPKTPDGSLKSDSVSLSPLRCGFSSPKSSPGSTKTLTLKDRLALSKTKKPSGSKSPPTSPNALSKYHKYFYL